MIHSDRFKDPLNFPVAPPAVKYLNICFMDWHKNLVQTFMIHR